MFWLVMGGFLQSSTFVDTLSYVIFMVMQMRSENVFLNKFVGCWWIHAHSDETTVIAVFLQAIKSTAHTSCVCLCLDLVVITEIINLFMWAYSVVLMMSFQGIFQLLSLVWCKWFSTNYLPWCWLCHMENIKNEGNASGYFVKLSLCSVTEIKRPWYDAQALNNILIDFKSQLKCHPFQEIHQQLLLPILGHGFVDVLITQYQ